MYLTNRELSLYWELDFSCCQCDCLLFNVYHNRNSSFLWEGWKWPVCRAREAVVVMFICFCFDMQNRKSIIFSSCTKIRYSNKEMALSVWLQQLLLKLLGSVPILLPTYLSFSYQGNTQRFHYVCNQKYSCIFGVIILHVLLYEL